MFWFDPFPVAGSAAQFNGSVSAMPSYARDEFDCLQSRARRIHCLTFGNNMSVVKFLITAFLVWFPASFGLGIAAEAVGIPDTDMWLWILRVAAAAMAAGAAWMVAGAAKATAIARAVLPVIGLITNLAYLLCLILGVVAVVMIFAKDSNWLYQHLYRPYVSPWIAVSLFSLVPIALLLLVFEKTRVLGGISLYLLSLLFGFALWFYSLMVSGSHGPGWVIGGLLMMGLGVILTAIVSSAVWGQWGVAGTLVLVATLIWGARMFGWTLAERQFEKHEDAERSGEPNKCAAPHGGPATRIGNSGVVEGPPSVS